MTIVSRYIETNTMRWHPLWGVCDLLWDTYGGEALIIAHLPGGEYNDVTFFDNNDDYYICEEDPFIIVSDSNTEHVLHALGWYYNKPVFIDVSKLRILYYEPVREAWIYRRDGLVGEIANFDGWGVEAYETSDIPCFFPSEETQIPMSPVDDTPESTVTIKLGHGELRVLSSQTRYGEYLGFGAAAGKRFRIGIGQWTDSNGRKFREAVFQPHRTDEPMRIRGLTYLNDRNVYILGEYGSAGWWEASADTVNIGEPIALEYVSPEGDSQENITLSWDGYTEPNDDDGAWIYICDTLCWR